MNRGSTIQDSYLIDHDPIVALTDNILNKAVVLQASDIHIEPLKSYSRVRLRINGELQHMMKLECEIYNRVISRIKVLASLNISKNILPQDGRFSIKFDDLTVDLRVSVLPTIYGEKVVIRLLNKETMVLSKNPLGLHDQDLKVFQKMIYAPHGMILVTGPTGSGKTTTLYVTLNKINAENKNIITIEDPVEYTLDGINQVQVHEKMGLSFSKGLKAILRQDPDIIMVGEIRDEQTAMIAVRAAITGHLVFSTLHTNDAASSITRMIDMEVEPYLISSCMIGIVAQRLVKKICPYCKTKISLEKNQKLLLNLEENVSVFKGKGCKKCRYTGYLGRQAVYEIMPITSSIKTLIEKRKSAHTIKQQAIEEGMRTLKFNCTNLVLQGVTTIDEWMRIAYGLE